MSAERHLHPVDLETGEVTCPRCEHLKPGDVENLEKENRRLLRKIRSLERDKQDEREASPNRTLILALIERWKNECGHPRSNAHSADRFDMISARLREGYTPQQIELAIDGIAAFPYVGPQGRQSHNGSGSKRHDRLGIALSSGESLERFANLGAMAKRKPNSTG